MKIMICVLIIGLLLFLLFLFYSKSRDGSSGNTVPVRPLPVSGQDLSHHMSELEQKMAGVAGGKTGMVMLLDMIQNSSEGDVSLDRERYRDLQEKLRGYMEEYDALLRQVQALPEGERLKPSEKIRQYRRLLDENV